VVDSTTEESGGVGEAKVVAASNAVVCDENEVVFVAEEHSSDSIDVAISDATSVVATESLDEGAVSDGKTVESSVVLVSEDQKDFVEEEALNVSDKVQADDAAEATVIGRETISSEPVSEAVAIEYVEKEVKDNEVPDSSTEEVVTPLATTERPPEVVVVIEAEGDTEVLLKEDAVSQSEEPGDSSNWIETSSVVSQGGGVSSWKRVRVHVRKVVAFHLRNVEILGKNDPYVSLRWMGDGSNNGSSGSNAGSTTSWHATTSVVEEGGSGAQWSYERGHQDMMFELDSADLQTGMLAAEVRDANSFRKDTLIGRGQTSMNDAAGAVWSDIKDMDGSVEVEVTVGLVDDAGKSGGAVTISLIVCESPAGAVVDLLGT